MRSFINAVSSAVTSVGDMPNTSEKDGIWQEDINASRFDDAIISKCG
jgi:hypothetical protein